MGNELGKIADGYIADLLLVKGDPITEVNLVQDKDNLLVIAQNGRLYKNALAKSAVEYTAVARD